MMRRRRDVRRRGEPGMVTAETAVVMPVLVLIAAMLVWLIGVGIAQVRCVDAARDAARALARDEPRAVAAKLARQAAPDGAAVSFTESTGMVEVEVSYAASPPGGLLDGLATWRLVARSATPTEGSDDVPAS
ncbi:MAG: pilus assembly protein TadE [Propionibacteriales bacterium]|nr:pilus assembly protein TadE [Propionibacteriales bacterium]